MPLQYAAIFKGYENYLCFDEKNIVSFFCSKHRTSTHNLYLRANKKHTSNVNHCKRQFNYIIIKSGVLGGLHYTDMLTWCLFFYFLLRAWMMHGVL